MRARAWSRSEGAKRRAFFGRCEKRGPEPADHLDGLMKMGRKCQMVEDGNLRLGSEESMILCHIIFNGKSHIL